MIELELEPDVKGPEPHSHSDHTHAFFVLAGELEFRLEDTSVVARAGLVRGRAARRRAHLHERPPGWPHAQHPCAGDRLRGAASRDVMTNVSPGTMQPAA